MVPTWSSNVLLIRWSWMSFWCSVISAYKIISFFLGSNCSTSAFIRRRRNGRSIEWSFDITYIYITDYLNSSSRKVKNGWGLQHNQWKHYLNPPFLFCLFGLIIIVAPPWQIKPVKKKMWMTNLTWYWKNNKVKHDELCLICWRSYKNQDGDKIW